MSSQEGVLDSPHRWSAGVNRRALRKPPGFIGRSNPDHVKPASEIMGCRRQDGSTAASRATTNGADTKSSSDNNNIRALVTPFR
jgi:hypothetical protein